MADKDGGPALLPLVSGGHAVVSPQDLLRLSVHRWRLGGNGYVYKVGGRKKGVPCLPHRIVMGAQSGEEIHHWNETRTDCRRANLERTTPSAHQNHHKHLLITRNRANRRYPLTGTCKFCRITYTKDRNHRGRQTCCSKACAMALAVNARRKPADG